jgi:N-acyl-D-amino-acid deacylase
MTKLDLVIRGGTIVDGRGSAPFKGDLGIADGRIVAVGDVPGTGAREIDAAGRVVTPGFIDIHTHYDGQVTWDESTQPSVTHGVTTVVMGNCGVGFAPCRADDRLRLVHLMEGVEDIPEIVMTTGIPWNWETFPEYLDAVDSKPRDIDVAAQLPHSALRVYVMGERAIAGARATENDLEKMADIAEDAVRAGAIGFATSRSIFHSGSDGAAIPSLNTHAKELDAITAGMNRAGGGVIEVLIDYSELDSEFDVVRGVAQRAGMPLSISLFQNIMYPTAWKDILAKLDDANAEGIEMRAQVIGRPTGFLLGLDVSHNPLSLRPSLQAIAHLPLKEKVAELRKPEVRQRILSEESGKRQYEFQQFFTRYDWMFPLCDPPVYEPELSTSVAKRAEQTGSSPEEIVYDLMLENDGNTLLFLPIANFVDGNLDAVLEMMEHEHTLLGLGDGGAHYGVICDAGYPTFMLTYWARDRKAGRRLSLEAVVEALSSKPAAAVGLCDRGVLAAGYKADVNIIDFDRLRLHAPRPVYDLPGGGRRLLQPADGFSATIVNGEVIYENGNPTGRLPGRLVRGRQPAPSA